MLIPENYMHLHLQDLQNLKDASPEKSTLAANKSISTSQAGWRTNLKMWYSSSLFSTVIFTNTAVSIRVKSVQLQCLNSADCSEVALDLQQWKMD